MSDIDQASQDKLFRSLEMLGLAQKGQREAVELLSKMDVDFGFVHQGGTALMHAVEAGDLEMVEFLMPHSNPSNTGDGGQDALMWAAKASGGPESVAILEALLPFSDPSRVDQNGLGALMHAVEAGWVEMAKPLLARSDPLAIDASGRDIVDIARASGSLAMLNMVSGHLCADPELRRAYESRQPGARQVVDLVSTVKRKLG